MWISTTFLTIVLCLLVVNTSQEETANDLTTIALLFKLGLKFILLNLSKVGNATLVKDQNFTLPNDQTVINGHLNLQNTYAFGFDGLKIKNLESKAVDSAVNLCINVTLDQIGVQTDYIADIGISSKVPIYGDGKVTLAVAEPDLNLCLDLNLADMTKPNVQNLNLNLNFRDSPMAITGFWKNDDISNLLTVILNISGKYIAMWWNYERECISCVLDPLLQYLINSLLGQDSVPKIECSCLKDMFNNEYNLEENLNIFLDAWINKDDISSYLKTIDKNKLANYLQYAMDKFDAVLKTNINDYY